jgi:trans-aconitate methyltransferase
MSHDHVFEKQSQEQYDIYKNLDFTREVIVGEKWDGFAKTAAYVIHHFDKDTEVADIGCGTGFSGALLKLSGFTNADGYDIVERYIETSYQYYREVSFCDVVSSALPKKYEVIIASGIFDFKGLNSNCKENIYNSLEEGGCIVMTVPAGTTEYTDIENWFTHFEMWRKGQPWTGRSVPSTTKKKDGTPITTSIDYQVWVLRKRDEVGVFPKTQKVVIEQLDVDYTGKPI